MANYYFSISSGSNATGDGSIGNPWATFKGKKDGTQALSSADSCLFLCNDIWVASSAEVVVNSSGTSVSKIFIGSYGSGTKPIFAGAPITSTGWVATGVSSIYSITNQIQSILKTVTQNDSQGLCRWQGANSGLPAGTFIRSGSTLFVHLWGDADPSVSNMRIANFAHSSTNDGSRGLVSSSRLDGHTGCYVNFDNLKVIGANGIGFSSSGSSNYFTNCEAIGCGQEGVLFYGDPFGENADSSRFSNGEISYCAANGGGSGQGTTTYVSNTWWVDSLIHDNFLAGCDFLASDTGKTVTQCGVLRCTFYNNGRWIDGSNYDPNIYVDGGNNIFIYGNTVWGGGKTGQTNAAIGISFGSENPSIRPCHDIFVVNNLVSDIHWVGIDGNNATLNTSNISNIKIINNTVISNLEGTFDFCWGAGYHHPNTSNWIVKNNIFIAGSNGTQRADLYADTSGYLLADNNLYWQIGGGTAIYQSNGIDLTLAQWQASNGQDLHAIRSDPLLVKLSSLSPDAHLGANSPAIQLGVVNPYTPPAWLPADLFPFGGGVRGVARSDGTVDPASTALDAGFHYLSGANTAAAVGGPIKSYVGQMQFLLVG